MLQDVTSEVAKVYLPLRLNVFVDDTTAFMEGRNKELACVAEKVLKSKKSDVKAKGLKLSITDGGKEGKKKVFGVRFFPTSSVFLFYF